MKTRLILCVLFGLFVARPAHADRDIVYSARYYKLRETIRNTSAEHLYRINPDGSGKMQITRGRFVDEEPQWSADGRYIYFYRRSTMQDWFHVPKMICRCNADGSGIRTIYQPSSVNSWLAALQLSADGKRIIFEERTDGGPGIGLIERHLLIDQDGKLIKKLEKCDEIISSPFDNQFMARINSDWYLFDPALKKRWLPIQVGWTVGWLSPDKLICSERKSFNEVDVYTFDLTSHGAKPVQLTVNAADAMETKEWGSVIFGLLNVPGTKDHIITVAITRRHGSGLNHEYHYLNLLTGDRDLIAKGEFLDWDRDRSRVLTSTPPQSVSHGSDNQIEVSKLLVRSVKSTTWTAIVKGQVLVHTASWRKSGSH